MNKQISNPAFQETTSPSLGFNLIPVVNTFASIFDPKDLDPDEEVQMQNLLLENFQLTGAAEDAEKEKLSQDFKTIKTLTSEIKAIQKQNLILLGERINKVRTLLKSYKDGTFTKWLKSVFHSKQTGYNILSYYSFFIALPTDIQEIFKKLPQKTAYALASREGDIQSKIEILQDPSIGPENIFPAIREKLPLASDDKRKTKGAPFLLLDELLKVSEKLHASKEPLNAQHREQLKTILCLLQEILEPG